MASNEIKNKLLSALPTNVFDALRPDLVHVELQARTQIYAPDDEVQWVYFPSSGMISMLQSTVDSRGIELATIGAEGALGTMAGFGLNRALTSSVVQMPLTAVRISAPNFRKAVSQYASVQELALRSNEVILAQPRSLRPATRFTMWSSDSADGCCKPGIVRKATPSRSPR